jgi:hypothetical protein
MKYVAEYINYSRIEFEADTIQEAIDKSLTVKPSEIVSKAEGWGFNTVKEQQ